MTTDDEVCELWLCEAHHLVLQPDRLYRFVVDENCDECRKYVDSYRDHREDDDG